MPELSVLIPCMNEAHMLRPLIERLQRVCIESDIDLETIILDDASQDDTIGIAKAIQRQFRALNIRVIHHAKPKRGYGALIRYGLAHATGRYCLLASTNATHPIEALPRFLTEARSGAHLVECCSCNGRRNGQDVPSTSRPFHAIYRLLGRLLLPVNVHDPTCSFKLIDRIYLMAIGIRSNGRAVVPEISLKMCLSGAKVASIEEVQVSTKPDILQFRLMREGFGYVYVLLRAWWHRLGFSWF